MPATSWNPSSYGSISSSRLVPAPGGLFTNLVSTLRPGVLWRHPERELFRAPDHLDRYLTPHPLLREQPVQVVDARHRPPVEPDDQVTLGEPRVPCGALPLEGYDQHGALGGQPEVAHHARQQRHVLPGDPDEAAHHPPVPYEPPGDELRRIYGCREADPLRGHDHRRVDADHLPARVHQRPTRVAGV